MGLEDSARRAQGNTGRAEEAVFDFAVADGNMTK